MEARALGEFNEEFKTYLDTTCDKMGEDWDAELKFPTLIGNKYHEKLYILQFLGDMDKKYSHFYFYLCKGKYPVPDTGLKKLSKDLQNASIMNEYHMIRNGYQIVPSKGFKQISFCCNRTRIYQGNLQKDVC